MYKKAILPFLLACLIGLGAQAQRDSLYSQQEVIYGHKDGMALTMLVTTPKKINKNRAIVYVVSGGYASNIRWVPGFTSISNEFFKRGYTVFFVLHGSTPVYTAPDAMADLQRSVQFIRYHAKEYNIDPNHIGITGASSGGNLSLLMGVKDIKVEKSADPIAKVSSKVQAVACFYPPTDYLNYGIPNRPIMKDSSVMQIVKNGNMLPALDFRVMNDTAKRMQVVTDAKQMALVLKKISPIYFVDNTTAPTLIYHGDADPLVPIQQSITFIDKLKANHVPAKLLIKKGGMHGWRDTNADVVLFADWFDEYLK